MWAKNKKKVDLYVNHETSLVPFPYTPSAPTEANSQNDFENAQLSHLELAPHTAGILSGELAITSHDNYQRFCSNFLADEENGFDKPLVFTNEEGLDWELIAVDDHSGDRRSEPTTRVKSGPSSPTTRETARASRSGAWAG